jgi:hypothetical protein
MPQTFRIKSPLRLLTPLIVTCIATLGILLAVTEPEDRWTVYYVRRESKERV